MDRNSKYSTEEKLSILNELSHSSVKEVARKYSVNDSTILHIGNYFINTKGLMDCDLLTTIVAIQRNLSWLWFNNIRNQQTPLKYSQSNMD